MLHTVAFAALMIWNRYDSGLADANLPVDGLAVRTKVPSGCWPFTGDFGVGAVTFNVEPSAAASELPASAPDGATGVSGVRPHATAIVRMQAAAGMQIFVRSISLLLQRVGTGSPHERVGVAGILLQRPRFFSAKFDRSIAACVLP
jgi:hypothetical protein